MNDNQKYILEVCKERTSANPLTRKELKEITHLNDRMARGQIESLREQGYRIINDSRGYWYATDEEYKAWLPKYRAYAETIYRRIRKMDAHVEGQFSL